MNELTPSALLAIWDALSSSPVPLEYECACVCVYVCERERERERGSFSSAPLELFSPVLPFNFRLSISVVRIGLSRRC